QRRVAVGRRRRSVRAGQAHAGHRVDDLGGPAQRAVRRAPRRGRCRRGDTGVVPVPQWWPVRRRREPGHRRRIPHRLQRGRGVRGRPGRRRTPRHRQRVEGRGPGLAPVLTGPPRPARHARTPLAPPHHPRTTHKKAAMRNNELPDGLHPDTLGVRAGQMRTGFEETTGPMFLNSGYVYESAEAAEASFNGEKQRFVYSRYGNPTVAMFQERLRQIEGAEACFATSSGMSAVFVALAALCGSGSRLVASRALFGSCYVICAEILPRWGVETVFVDGDDTEQWREALSVPTDAVFFESPSNPMQELVDVRAVCDLAHEAGAQVVVDNVFATVLHQKPLELGADVVVYSTTNHIDGQGRVLGGAVLGTEEYISGPVKKLMRHAGFGMSAFNAWVLLKGLETMGLRLERMSA